MIIQAIHSFQSEWLKTKRSAASWLTIAGALLVPMIYLISRLFDVNEVYQASQAERVWEFLFARCWDITNIMLLPLGVILATSLIAQLEFRNNTWKQLHTTPQSITLIFFVKLFVIMVMLLQFFILFNLGVYLNGVFPAIFFRGVPFPKESIPFVLFLKMNLKFFIDCLPIVALQYLISIQFKNFLLPLGIGIGLYVSSIIAVSWKYGYFIPYTYIILNSMRKQSPIDPQINTHAWAIGFFIVIMLLSYVLFITKKEKG